MATQKMTLEIPKEDLKVLRQIIDLEESQFNSLLLALRDTKPTLRRGPFADQVVGKVKAIQPQDLNAILRVAFTLYTIKDRERIGSRELAELVSKSAIESSSKELSFPSDKRQVLGERLKNLLDFNKSVGVSVKAIDILTEHEHVFCGARILSDIRPVFADTPENASAAVVVHNLQICFHHNGEHKEFYVALDTDDIQTLKDVILRAEQKTSALRSLLNRAKVHYLHA